MGGIEVRGAEASPFNIEKSFVDGGIQMDMQSMDLRF